MKVLAVSMNFPRRRFESNRVDIVSPGGVCMGITLESFGTISITRNPLVQSMFYRIDYILM